MKKIAILLVVLSVIILSPAAQASPTNHLKTGIVAGSISGTAIGLISSAVVAQKYRCSANQEAHGEACWVANTIIIGGTLGGAGIGTGLGALIGSVVPKKQNFSVTPVVSYDKKIGVTGGGMFFNKAF